ncbi:hypothetical protein MC885_008745 [Smutsia gigantea]|nr:hypothetical protein MC885_008745 [Smutsia gigantea]
MATGLLKAKKELFSSFCAGNHLHPEKHYPEDQKQQQEQVFEQVCLSNKIEIQEREDSKPLSGSRSRSISKALSCPPRGQPARPQEDSTMVGVRPSPDQKAELEEADKVLHGLEASGFGAVKYGEFGLHFIKESHLFSLQNTHRGETAYTKQTKRQICQI